MFITKLELELILSIKRHSLLNGNYIDFKKVKFPKGDHEFEIKLNIENRFDLY